MLHAQICHVTRVLNSVLSLPPKPILKEGEEKKITLDLKVSTTIIQQ